MESIGCRYVEVIVSMEALLNKGWYNDWIWWADMFVASERL